MQVLRSGAFHTALQTLSVVIVGLTGAVLIDLGKAITSVKFILLRCAASKDRTFPVAGDADGVTAVRCEAVGS